jgi:hypothetical protein
MSQKKVNQKKVNIHMIGLIAEKENAEYVTAMHKKTILKKSFIAVRL